MATLRFRGQTRLLRPATAAVYGLLPLAVLAAFAGVLRCGFVYDDRATIIENPLLRSGFGARAVLDMFTSMYAANWHPLTWLSHLLDVELYGFDPRGHHATSLLIHGLASLLLLALLRAMTGSPWRSAWVAAAFALHPLRVESVAWVSERKDVLSLLLGLLAISAYLHWVRRPCRRRYALLLAAAAAALMSKPMLVSLPLCLLLLDYWPLGRLSAPSGPRWRTMLRLLAEKLPLAALASAVAVLTLVAQAEGGAVLATVPPLSRVGNALVSLARYLGMTLWPVDLAVFYPLPSAAPSAGKLWLPAALAAAITVAALGMLRRCPQLAFGWFWFVLTLSPVLGFVQVGLQALADRYTYLPHVGLFVGIAWTIADLARRHPRSRTLVASLALLTVPLLAARTAHQVGFWRDDLSLFARAAAVSPESWFIRYNYATALMERGRLAAAEREFAGVLRLSPGHVDARLNLGHVLERLGRLEEAEIKNREVLHLAPGEVDAWFNLGVILAKQGRRDEAIAHLQEALALQPRHEAARANLNFLQRERAAGR